MSGSTAPYPNENDRFSYLLSDNGGIDEVSFKLSEGSYDITDIKMGRFSPDLFHEKVVQPVFRQMENRQGNHTVLSCCAEVPEGGYFVTSIPMQRGMKLFADGKEIHIETVNQAFVGAGLSEGIHEIELKFFPPGQRTGYMVSLISWIAFAGNCIWKKRRKQ